MSSKKTPKKKANLPDIEVNPVGRPTKYKPEYCEQLIAYQREGGSYQGFAGLVSVDVTTLYQWEEDFPEFSQARKEAKMANRFYMDGIAKGMMEGTIKGGNVVVWLFLMKNYHGLMNDPLPEADDIRKVEIGFTDEGEYDK